MEETCQRYRDQSTYRVPIAMFRLEDKMKHKMSLILICTLIALMLGGNQTAGVSAGNSSFTYEGYLEENGDPAVGIYDFRFTLYDASKDGNQIGNVITLEDIAVNNGLFSVSLDFGAGAFNGEPRWLDVGARPGNSTGQYTPHLPRHALGSAPWSEFPGGGRSAHDHLGQTWTGSSPLIINGAYREEDWNAPLVLSNDVGHGLRILNTGGAGVYVDSAATNGIRVRSAGANGLRIDSAANAIGVSSVGGTAFWVDYAGETGIALGTVGGTGIWVGDTGGSGVSVANAGVQGVEVENAGDNGLLIVNAGKNGVEVDSATNGLWVGNAGVLGVGVDYAKEVAYWVHKVDGGAFWVDETGGQAIGVGSAGQSGLLVVSAGDHGVHVQNAGLDGVAVDSAGDNGLYVGNAVNSGVAVGSAGAEGLYVGSAGNNGLFVANAGGNGVAVGSSSYQGVYVGSTGDNGLYVANAGNNGVAVNSANNSGLWVGSAGGNGLNVESAGADGVAVYSAGANGLYVDNAGNNGVQVDNAGGYAGWFGGSIYARDGCVGCTITMFGVNAGSAALQPGDIVSIQGLLPSQFAEAATLMQVKAAENGETVIGVVQGRAEVSRGIDSQQGNSQDRLVPRQGEVEPGEYVTIIIYGPAQVKASALSGSISAGTRLTLGEDGGVRTLLTTEVNGVQIAESASTIGIALEEPGDNKLIWVLVNPQ